MARTDFVSQLTLHGDQDLSPNQREIPQMINQLPDIHSALVRCHMSQMEGLYFVTVSQESERKARQGSLELHLAFFPFSNKYQTYPLLVDSGTFS